MKQRLAAVRLGLPILIASLVGGAVAPVAAADKETRQMMADVRMLQEQAQQLQILLGSVNDALQAVNKRLDEQAEVNRKAFADQKITIDTVGRDLGVVREKVDDTIVRVGSLGQEVEALRQSVETLGTPPAFGAPPPVDTAGATDPGAPVQPPAASATPAAVGLSPTRLMTEAKSDYSLARWDLAISGFEAYIKTFPRSDEADDAQLLIGNAYSQDGKYPRAIEAYDLAIRTYPKGNVIPDAYYKKGVAHASLRQLDQAREAFEMVVKNYPESAAAILAGQRLQELTKKP